MTKLGISLAAQQDLRQTIESYAKIKDSTWNSLQEICHCKYLSKGEVLYNAGSTPNSLSYVYKGLLRSFTIDNNGNEYSKNFFDQGHFPGSMRALLQSLPSQFTISALESSVIIEIPFTDYRQLLIENHDFALFHIAYLEQHWVISKDIREVEIVMNDATERYHKFLHDHPQLVGRIQQYHLASHLGITPTQLSRIRKKIITNQPM